MGNLKQLSKNWLKSWLILILKKLKDGSNKMHHVQNIGHSSLRLCEFFVTLRLMDFFKIIIISNMEKNKNIYSRSQWNGW